MFVFPWSNLHELNLDWILQQVKQFAELIPPMSTAVEDVQALQTDVEQAVEDANQAVEDAQAAIETAEEAKEIAEQAAQGTIADGAVTTVKLDDDAVTTAKIADGAVTGTKIANATIQAANLASGCVTTTQILDGTISPDDLGTECVTNSKIGAAAVTTNKIDDGAVTAAKIGAGAVTNAKIADGAINSAKLGTDVQTILDNKDIKILRKTLIISGVKQTALTQTFGFTVPTGYTYAFCTLDGVGGTGSGSSVITLHSYTASPEGSVQCYSLVVDPNVDVRVSAVFVRDSSKIEDVT